MKSEINSPSQLPVRRSASDEGGSTLNPQPRWKGVFFGGPQSSQDAEGEEIPVWVVYVGDEDANPLGKVYTVGSYAYAATLARSMARERNLELIDEAMPA